MTMRLAIIAAVTISAALPVVAQTKSSDRILQDFGKCRATSDERARLACFEKTFDGFEAAVKSKDVTIVDRQDVKEARRSLFGFTVPKINLFGGGGKDEVTPEFEEINTTVASAREGANGRVEIRLADDTGAVWQTTDPMNFAPRAGARIRIRQGALGNYFLFVDGRSYRGLRVR